MKEKSLGDRMKRYEMEEAGRSLMPNLPILARLDGRAFHTLTRGMNKPYDQYFMICMIATMKELVNEFHATLGYTQSDEITLYWENSNPFSDMLFDGRLQKWHSILASACSVEFFQQYLAYFSGRHNKPPRIQFDCRVWQVPNKQEVYHNFLWREEDAVRNSLQMAGQSEFGHKKMHKKNTANIHDMLMLERGINWNDYPVAFKRGTYVTRRTSEKPLSEAQLARIPEKHRDKVATAMRSEVVILDLPPLSKITHFQLTDHLYQFGTRSTFDCDKVAKPVAPARKDVRPIEHMPNCQALLYNGNFPCDCGEDDRWNREYTAKYG